MIGSRLRRNFLFGRFVFLLTFQICFFQLVSAAVVNQTKDDHTGIWSDVNSWEGTYPGTDISVSGDEVEIYGFISRNGNLTVSSGTLVVRDTLLIYGDLDIANNGDLSITNGGILIVYGDYNSGNQTIVTAGGYFIVAGNFEMTGSDNQGSFDIDGGNVFIFDTTPTIKTGSGYTDLSCSDPDDYPTNCGYGNEDDLSGTGIFDLFNGGGFTIELSGPDTFCPGSSTDLSISTNPSSASNFQWFLDNAAIPGANSSTYTANQSGDYHVTFDLGTNSFDLAPVALTVEDTEDPTITAPADVTVNVDAGSCEATGVALGTPTTSDNCSSGYSNDAPTNFPLGTTTVTWTVTDGSGNTATDTQTVTVVDNENPTITSPANVTVNIDAGSCEATSVALGTPTTGDNCSSSYNNDAPLNFPLGTTTVTWTAIDGSGNTATATQMVTVIDNEDPTITAPADVTVNVDAGSCEATGVALGTPTTGDNCSSGYSNNAPTNFPLGTTTVTWTVTDGSGNIATATQTVTVIDNEDPTIAAPANVTVNVDAGTCGATGVVLGTPIVGDNCSATSNYDAPVTFSLGMTTVTWTAIDGSGNTATATQTVTVIDNENPTITAPTNVTVNVDAGSCEATGVALGTPTTGDNCSSSYNNDAPTNFPLGTTTVTWTVTDGSGNTTTDTQTVTVVDNEDPTITAPANVTVNVDAGSCEATGVALGTPTTNDNCSSGYSNNAPLNFPLGTTTVTWTVTDGSGNSATDTQSVTVIDNENPTITAPADVTVNVDAGSCEATGVALGTPTTSDNCSVASVTNNSAEPYPLGTTTITWTVVDGSGNTTTATQTVTVVDDVIPTITAPEDITVNVNAGSCFATIADLGTPITYDNCGIKTLSNDAPTNFQVGVTDVIWTVVDNSDNTVTAIQKVTVNDDILPTVIATPKDIIVEVLDESCDVVVNWQEPIFSDNCSVQFTSNYQPGDAFGVGAHTVTYEGVDPSGNTVSTSFNINVQVVANRLTIYGNNTFCLANSIYRFSSNYASGVWSGNGITNQTSGAFNPSIAGEGTHTITYTVTNSGCQVTATKEVQVNQSIEKPVISETPVIEACEGESVNLTGPDNFQYLWSDNSISQSIDITQPGVYSLTISNGQGCSNTSDEVEIIFNPLPVVTAQNMEIELDEGIIDLTSGQPTGGLYSGFGVSNNQFNPIPVGVGDHTVTYTYQDENSCENSVDFIISVIDTQVDLPNVTFQMDDIYCMADTIELKATLEGEYDGFVWFVDEGKGTLLMPGSTTAKYIIDNSEDSVRARLMVWNDSDTANHRKSVLVVPDFEPSFTWLANEADPLEVHFTADIGNGESYYWSFGDGNTSEGFETDHRYKESGFYNINLQVSKSGCLSDTNWEIEVSDGWDLFVPSAIYVQSSDVENRTAKVYGKGLVEGDFIWKIFNSWGQEVYASHDLTNAMNRGWDGTKNGSILPNGAYNYVLKVKRYDDIIETRSGSITIFR